MDQVILLFIFKKSITRSAVILLAALSHTHFVGRVAKNEPDLIRANLQ